MKRLWMSALIGVCVLGLGAQDPNRTLRPQQATAVRPVVQEARIALVIGNSAYAEAFLKNPVNDAREMKTALESCKFEVTLLTNASKRQMEDAIAVFGNRIRGGAVGLFYFAGHGLQVRGANYLIPVGARLDKESDVTYEGVDVGKVLDEMDAAKNKLNLLILDACRNNPFARSWRSADKGLAQVSAPTGSLIAYATAPGRTAADGTGEHGAYTEALLAELREPGLKAEDLFKRVRVRVTQVTGDQQVPWESSSLKGDFYFRPLATNITGPTIAELEATYWGGILDSRDPKEYEFFLSKFPNGSFAELAKAKLTNLRRVSQSLVVNNLAEPWKALLRDTLETKEEFAARIAQLGVIRIGDARVSVDNYDVETKRLTLPIKPDLWAKPYVKRDKLVVEVDREQMRALVKAGPTAKLVARFEVWGEQPLAGGLKVDSRIGALIPLALPVPKRNVQGRTEALVKLEGVQIALVQIPPGDFSMGTTDTKFRTLETSRPVHQVTISHEVWLGKFPVTQGQWQAVMGNNPSNFKNAGADAPVEQVSWKDAQQFLAKVNGMQDAWTFRLPTEAEWEYACRAGTTTETYAGANTSEGYLNVPVLEDIAWYAGNSGVTYEGGVDNSKWWEWSTERRLQTHSGTHPVGRKMPNAFGLFDMNGNVLQWCQDWGGDYSPDSVIDPQGPSSGKDRIARGGAWNGTAANVRSASRFQGAPDESTALTGFRVCAIARAQ